MFVRTNYATRDDNRHAEELARSYGVEVTCVYDKGVELKLNDEHGFRAMMQRRGLGYMLDD